MKLKLLLSFAVAVGAVLALPSNVAAQTSPTITLAWNPSSGLNLAGYRVLSGTASGVYPNTTNVGNVTSTVIGGLTAGQTYYFAVAAVDIFGIVSLPSNEVSYQVPANPPPPPPPPPPTNNPPPPPATNNLPPPWDTAGIGLISGGASELNGVYQVQGAGTLSGTSDQFRFVFQPLSGNGEIKVRVASVEATGAAGRVGIMIRESLAAGSKYAFIGLSPDGTVRWQRRDLTGANTSAGTSRTASTTNAWFRLVRTGNSFVSYKSANGTNWTKVNSRSITMATNISFGLAVASGSTNTLHTATFVNVSAVP